MDSSPRALPHLPFFEALATLDESSDDWHAITAGLVTLRLFDAWIADGPGVVAAGAFGLRAVREAIGRVSRGNTTRALLTSVVDAMECAVVVQVPMVAPRLMAYARALQFDAKWALATDVYRTVLARAHPSEDADIVVNGNMQLGACLRVLGDMGQAAEAYGRAAQIARRTGDAVNVLRSQIAEANLAIDRGNLPHAEQILDRTIRQAKRKGLTEVWALATHERANVAHRRGSYELSVRLIHEALGSLRMPSARDRALADLAASFYELGVRSAARDAHLILAYTAQEQYSRWVATINLLEIAAVDRCEPVFEQYRRELAGASLPPMLAAYYELYLGQGYRMFERFEPARAALERAVVIASRHHLNEVLIKAEASLGQLRAGGLVVPRAAVKPSPAVARVASAIREMRALVGVAG